MRSHLSEGLHSLELFECAEEFTKPGVYLTLVLSDSAEGKAYFVEDAETAHLNVSFFGLFYGSYVVFE